MYKLTIIVLTFFLYILFVIAGNYIVVTCYVMHRLSAISVAVTSVHDVVSFTRLVITFTLYVCHGHKYEIANVLRGIWHCVWLNLKTNIMLYNTLLVSLVILHVSLNDDPLPTLFIVIFTVDMGCAWANNMDLHTALFSLFSVICRLSVLFALIVPLV